MKRILIYIFLIFIFTISFSVLGYSLSIYSPPPVYVPIDSLSKEYLYYNIKPDFKKDIFTCKVEDKVLSFKLTNDIQSYSTVSTDTAKNARYNNYSVFITALFDENTEIHFWFDKLVSFSEDSIYVSVHYQKKSIEKGCDVGKYVKIRSIGISKKELNGLQILFYPDGTKTVQNHLIAGYTIMPGRKHNITNHAIELGWSRITSHQNILTSSYYISNEFAFNKNAFFIGPKIGGQVSFFLFGLGSELVCYTDFYDSSLQWVPFFYIGFGDYKLHFDGRVPIYNKEFQRMNNFSMGFSMPIIPLSKKRAKL